MYFDDAALRREIVRITDGADLNVLSSKKVRKMLEQTLGIDLSEHKKYVDSLLVVHISGEDMGTVPSVFGTGGGGDVKKEEETEQSEDFSDVDYDVEDFDAPPVKRSKTGATTKAKRGGGVLSEAAKNNPFNKEYPLSEDLKTLIGLEQASRPQCVKRLWALIKERDLQDPKDKRQILCDSEFKKVFGVDSMSCFYMNSLLSRHLIGAKQKPKLEKLEGETDEEMARRLQSETSGLRTRRGASKKNASGKKQKKKRKPMSEEAKERLKNNSPFNKDMQLSEVLQRVVGVSRLSRPQVVKKLWEIIREKDLQDPEDKR
eukprot:Nk52_evm8s2473 gene=Nk52_evmTU8s2473